MGALACTPAGTDDGSAPPRLGPGLLPGEALLAFAHWPRDDASLTVYPSGAVDYRARNPTGRDFRLSDASLNDVLKLMRLFGEPGFAERRSPVESVVATLYAPAPDHSVDIMDGSGASPVAEAFSVVAGLRAEAVESGTDPFSTLAPRVVGPLLVHTMRRPEQGYDQEVAVFDNGALEIRRTPAGDAALAPWAASRRVRPGTLFELRQAVATLDAEVPIPPSRSIQPPRHELITARTRRAFHAIRSEPTRTLLDAIERIVSSIDVPA